MPFKAGNFALKVLVLQLLKDQAIYLFCDCGNAWVVVDSRQRSKTALTLIDLFYKVGSQKCKHSFVQAILQ